MNRRINQHIFVSLQRNSSCMKKILFLFLLSPLFAVAQDETLLVEGVTPDLYIVHVVAAKENYYSIGRIYNISPKEIPPLNNLKLETGLDLGQNLKVPLNSTNFFQQGKARSDETFVPVYYVVKEKEGLFRIALSHNKLPLETLKKWNHITGDGVQIGTKLIVGYLKVKHQMSYLAKNGIGTVIGDDVTAVVKPGEKKMDEPEKKASAETEPEIANAELVNKEPVKPVTEEQVKVKPIEEAESMIVKKTKKAEVKTVKAPVTGDREKTAAAKVIAGGAFKKTYEYQTINAGIVETEGSAGVFKSTSGWSDKKYYCLYNQASQGTIIKVTNPANEKYVYVKVLDLIPDIRQNSGLTLIVSNAAADELGVADGNFDCILKYSK